jgi:hypothetical protein
MKEEVWEAIDELECEIENTQLIMNAVVEKLKIGDKDIKIGNKILEAKEVAKGVSDQLFILNNSILMDEIIEAKEKNDEGKMLHISRRKEKSGDYFGNKELEQSDFN